MLSRIGYYAKSLRTGLKYTRHLNQSLMARSYSTVLPNSENVKLNDEVIPETDSTDPTTDPIEPTDQNPSTDDEQTTNDKDMEVIDVDIDKMILDDDYVPDYKPPPSCPSVITTPDLSGNALAPIDIDPWIDELKAAEGTVFYDNKLEKEEVMTYPDPPADRDGFYAYKGIKIWLPKRLLSPGTFRYCLDVNKHQFIDDDMRICRFEKSINEAKNH